MALHGLDWVPQRRGRVIARGCGALRIWAALFMIGFGVFACFGFFTLQPNEARVLILFGAYKGTVRQQRLPLGEPAVRAQPR